MCIYTTNKNPNIRLSIWAPEISSKGCLLKARWNGIQVIHYLNRDLYFSAALPKTLSTSLPCVSWSIVSHFRQLEGYAEAQGVLPAPLMLWRLYM